MDNPINKFDLKSSIHFIDNNRKTNNLDVPSELIDFWRISHPDDLSIIHMEQWTIFLYVLDSEKNNDPADIELMNNPEFRKLFHVWQTALTITYLTNNKAINVLPFELFNIYSLCTLKFTMKKI